MARPEIAEALQRLLDITVEDWERSGRWPKRIKVAAQLKREGLYSGGDLSKVIVGNWYKQLGDVIELNLYGVARARGGERWARHFVPLVERAISRFIASPSSASVTNADLEEMLGPEEAARSKDLCEMYFWCLGPLSASRTGDPAGRMTLHVNANCLRYRGLESIWDFRERLPYPGPPNAVMTAEQRQMTTWFLRAWRSSGAEVTGVDVVLAHLHLADPVGAWEELPVGLFVGATEQFRSGRSGPVQPRIPLLLALRPESDNDLEVLRRVIFFVRDHLERDGEPPTLDLVASTLGTTEVEIAKLVRIASEELPTGVGLVVRDSGGSFKADEMVFGLPPLDSLDSMVAWIEETARRNRWPGYAPEADQAESARVASEEAARQTFFNHQGMHPRIQEVAAPAISSSIFRSAVLDSMICLTQMVKDKAGRSDLDGANLMRTVFSARAPKLAFNSRSSQGEIDEQEGLMHLFEGMMLIRNRLAHTLEADEPERAVEYVIFISMLAKILDEAIGSVSPT